MQGNVINFYLCRSRLLTHCLFWVAYILLYTGMHLGDDELWENFLYELFRLPGTLVVAYFNLYVLYPRFFARGRYVGYVLAAISLLLVCSVLNRYLLERVLEPDFMADTTHPEAIFVWYMLFKSMIWLLGPILLFTLFVRILQQWYGQQQQQQAIEKDRLRSELNYLRAQVQPHFLFNTLNNLYSLTLQQSPVAPAVVLKLSDLMSYMLYDAQAGRTSLEKELQHIRNYIELKKLRYGQRLEVSLNVSGDTTQIGVAPLLLIPFVENAFKHGVSDETGQVWITIDIKLKEGRLQLKVENSCSDQLPDAGTIRREQTGIGLQNVRRRLHLLYNGQHELVLLQEAGRHTADLTIHLSDA
ncbi:sensor histidine kinase [Paraflavitalea pollutisoli]|uniref:sensor histidine kinase n=1 Tax=Paraflavitalea pollutisoli TaxID=3034143 RepID=UPI0023EBD163|nr:histidine kinase [Paraflavitalea sp. H1-2-19X]